MRVLSILSFRDPNENIIYRTYLSSNYDSDPDLNAEDNYYNRFVDSIYSDINYDAQTPLNNNTKYGVLLEQHNKFLRNVDIEDVDQLTVYFFLYQPDNTNYLCVHRNSPILFDQNKAIEYANMQTELIPYNCQVNFI
jgi:hypothetical protein